MPDGVKDTGGYRGNVQFCPVDPPRSPGAKYHIHKHFPSVDDVDPSSKEPGKDITNHVLLWGFSAARMRWEAICERDDIIYTSPATEADYAFLKGRPHP